MIHVAGAMIGQVQRCERCHEVISDYRGGAVPIGQDWPTGFAEGAHVEIEGTNPRYLGLTDAPATCGVAHRAKAAIH